MYRVIDVKGKVCAVCYTTTHADLGCVQASLVWCTRLHGVKKNKIYYLVSAGSLAFTANSCHSNCSGDASMKQPGHFCNRCIACESMRSIRSLYAIAILSVCPSVCLTMLGCAQTVRDSALVTMGSQQETDITLAPLVTPNPTPSPYLGVGSPTPKLARRLARKRSEIAPRFQHTNYALCGGLPRGTTPTP
jgi:hypothetical protein